MKKYIFIGGERTGKSTMILSLAHILSKVDKNILIIDTTRSQGIYSFYNYNNDIENSKKIIRENCEIIISNPCEVCFANFDFSMLRQLDMNKYDYIFIEADHYFDVQLLDTVEKIFLFQDGDKHSLLKSKYILEKLKNYKSLDEKLIAVFSIFYDAKFDINYFTNELNSKDVLIKNNYTEIGFAEDDVTNILQSKLEGKLNIRDFSTDYKEALYSIINEIEKINEKQFRKFIK